jgi:hypothetical protein
MTAHPTSASNPDGHRRVLGLTAIAVAVALQLVVAVPFALGYGLLAPAWGIAAWTLWLTAAAALVVVARRRPLLAPAVPAANAALLFALVSFGESVQGWPG